MTTAQERFKRILLAIQLISRGGDEGVPVSELMKKVGYANTKELAEDMDFLEAVVLPGVGFNSYLAPVQRRQRIKFKYPVGRKMGSFPLSVNPKEALVLSIALERLVGEGVLSPRSMTVRLVSRILASVERRRKGVKRVLAIDAGHKQAGDKLDILRRAKERKKSAELVYYTASHGGLRKRLVDIYDLYFNGDEWYAIGYCRYGKGIRTFRVDRIKEARPSDKSYRKAPDYRLEDHISGSMFRPTGDAIRVILRFAAALAPGVREEFTEEKIKDRADGGVEVAVRSDVPSWVVNRALCYAEACELVRPVELRRELVDKAKGIMRLYQGPKRRNGEPAKRRGRKAKRSK